MPRIPFPNPESMDANVRAMVEKAALNPLRMYAHATPSALVGFIDFTSTFFSTSPLPEDLRQIAVLRVACLCNSTYVRLQHEALCREVGMEEAAIDAVKRGAPESPALTAPQQAVLRFSEDFIHAQVASDAVLADVRGHLNDQQLMDLMMVIGAYMLMARIIETTGVELDNQVLSASFIADTFVHSD